MFFWVFLGFSILLNYFALASLFNQYRAKRKELTAEMIDELTDRMELMNAEKINKISLSTKAQKQKLEEKNIIDVEIEKETYNIVIAKRAKALMRKKEIPLKIMNNQNVMEEKKAGFVVNPFGDESNNSQSVKTKPVNDEASQDGERQDGEHRQLNMNEFELLHKNMINLLFRDFTIVRHDRLRTRDEVVKTLHEQGHGRIRDLNTSMTKLYTKLLEDEFIYKKIGYFSNIYLD
jgi:hypothetical protein